MRSITIAAAQFEAAPFALEQNFHSAARWIEQAAEQSAALIVLPELFHVGYTYEPRLRLHGEPIDGPAGQWLRRWSRRTGAYIGGCIAEAHSGRLFDTFVLAAPDGTLAGYRKRFPAFFEHRLFHAGRDVGIIATPLGRIGVMICWDMVHAALLRELTGVVDLLIISSAWPDLTRGSLPIPGIGRWMTRQPKRRPRQLGAKLGVPVVFANQTGRFRIRVPGLGIPFEAPFVGRSAVIDASGQTLAMNRTDSALVCAIVDRRSTAIHVIPQIKAA